MGKWKSPYSSYGDPVGREFAGERVELAPDQLLQSYRDKATQKVERFVRAELATKCNGPPEVLIRVARAEIAMVRALPSDIAKAQEVAVRIVIRWTRFVALQGPERGRVTETLIGLIRHSPRVIDLREPGKHGSRPPLRGPRRAG